MRNQFKYLKLLMLLSLSNVSVDAADTNNSINNIVASTVNDSSEAKKKSTLSTTSTGEINDYNTIKATLINGMEIYYNKLEQFTCDDNEKPSGVGRMSLEVFDPQVLDSSSEVDVSPIYTTLEPIYVGASILENSDDVERTLKSSEFLATYTTRTSTSTTHGWSTGTNFEMGTKLKIPVINLDSSLKLSISAEYNGSTTNATERSVAMSYTAPSQDVPVPPHSKATVTVTLDAVQADGHYTFTQNMTGPAQLDVRLKCGTLFRPLRVWATTINDMLRSYRDWGYPLPNGLEAGTSNNFILKGNGIYKVQSGTVFTVRIEREPLVSGQSMKTTKTVQTYKIPAKISIAKDNVPQTNMAWPF